MRDTRTYRHPAIRTLVVAAGLLLTVGGTGRVTAATAAKGIAFTSPQFPYRLVYPASGWTYHRSRLSALKVDEFDYPQPKIEAALGCDHGIECQNILIYRATPPAQLKGITSDGALLRVYENSLRASGYANLKLSGPVMVAGHHLMLVSYEHSGFLVNTTATMYQKGYVWVFALEALLHHDAGPRSVFLSMLRSFQFTEQHTQ